MSISNKFTLLGVAANKDFNIIPLCNIIPVTPVVPVSGCPVSQYPAAQYPGVASASWCPSNLGEVKQNVRTWEGTNKTHEEVVGRLNTHRRGDRETPKWGPRNA